jgi:cytochrome c
MSKSLNLFLPVLGGIGLVLGTAYGIAQRGYQADVAEAALARATAAEAQANSLQAEIAAVQDAARIRIEELETRPVAASLSEPAPPIAGALGLGREALPEEIAAWNVDVLPDGRGLPEGSGNAFDGEEVYADKCAACHGYFAEGVDNWPVLAGGFDTLADEDPVKTVGSYWPYLSTAWDYIHRSMPFGEAGTLTADETYAIVAYILYSNDLIDEDFELTHENLGSFEMYNANGFVIDDRPELEYSQWRGEPCMTDCKDEVEVTMRSVFLVETPPEGGSNSVMNPARDEELPRFTAAGPSFIPAPSGTQAQAETVAVAAVAAEEEDPGDALVEAGSRVYAKCKACHQIGDGARNRTGPVLTGIMGRTMGTVDGFSYSGVFQSAAGEGRVWDEAEMAAFLAAPRDYMQGTRMAFAGLRSEEDITALIAYLRSFDD